MPLIFPIRPASKLAYPRSSPGINPAHPATPGAQIAVVVNPLNANYINLLTGLGCVNTQGSQITSAIVGTDGIIGPNLTAGTGCKALGTSFPNVPVGNFTAAAIFRYTTTNGGAYQCVATAGNAWGWWMHSGKPCLYTNTDNAASFTPTVGRCYFIAMSAPLFSGSIINYVMRDMITGQVFTSSVSQTSAASSTNLWTIGNDTSNEFSNFPLAVAMISTTVLSMPQLRQWADDPWGFWFPQQFDITSAISHAVSAAVVTKSSTLPMMGVG